MNNKSNRKGKREKKSLEWFHPNLQYYKKLQFRTFYMPLSVPQKDHKAYGMLS